MPNVTFSSVPSNAKLYIDGEEIPMAKWLAGWTYRKQIAVKENSGSALSYYQVAVDLQGNDAAAAGYVDFAKLQSTGDDLRFTSDDGVTLLPYWLESFDPVAKTAKVWIKTTAIPSMGLVWVWVYYGNASASSASDGDDTFEFFDDFEGIETILNYKIFGTDGALEGSIPAAWYGDIANPVAIYNASQNKTYIVYQFKDGSGNCDRKILYYDHATNIFSSATEIGGTTKVDDHGQPAIVIDASGYIYVFYYGGGATDIYFKKSTNVYDITSWGAQQTVPLGYHTYSQPHLHSDGNIYLFYLDYEGGTPSYCCFNRFNGTSWLGETKIIDPSTYYPYALSFRDSSGTFHVAWNWYNGSIRKDIYYMKSTDGGSTWTEADGTSLTIPVSETTGEKVHDSGVNYCNIALGDLQADSTGKPLILFNSNQVYKIARWNGTAWVVSTVIAVDNNHDCGTLVLDSDSHFRAYITVGTGRGGDLKEYISTDSGATWTYQKTIAEGAIHAVLNVNNLCSDRKLELVFNGGEGDIQAVSAWGKNCTYTTSQGLGVDLDKWSKSARGGTISITDNIVSLIPSDSANYNYALINSKSAYQANNIMMESRVYFEKTFPNVARYHKIGFGNISSIASNSVEWQGLDGYFYLSDSDRDGHIKRMVGVSSEPVSIKTCTDWAPADTWFRLKFYYLSDGTIGKIENSNATEEIVNTTWLSQNKKVGFSTGYVADYGGTMKIDWTFLRKYASPEPTIVLTEEQTLSTKRKMP